MTKILFAFMLASTFMVPHITPAVGNESATETAGIHGASSAQKGWDSLSLPAIPYLDTMPWLTRGSLTAGPKVDMLWPAPVGPFLLESNVPSSKFSSTHRSTESNPRTE
jgi:hypothetical protein